MTCHSNEGWQLLLDQPSTLSVPTPSHSVKCDDWLRRLQEGVRSESHPTCSCLG